MANVSIWIKQKLALMPNFASAASRLGSAVSGEAVESAHSRLGLGGGRMRAITALLSQYSRSDAASETLLARKILSLEVREGLDDYETRWLERLRELSLLRALVFGKPMEGKFGLRQGFAYARVPIPASAAEREIDRIGDPPSLQDVTESAILVADLYWKLYRTCSSEFPQMRKLALRLYREIFEVDFEEADARQRTSVLTDAMQRDHGMPFLMLNLIRQGRERSAKELSQLLLLGDSLLDEEIRTPLYWLSEIFWFTHEQGKAVGSYEATIRHLYHLCFTNPDRAGFLEIDSQFFPEFEMVSEIAREAFVFRDLLVDWILALWKDFDGLYDEVFQSVLEAISRRRSKIHDQRGSWEVFWKRESETYSRDYLHLAEGNLAYVAGDYQGAAECYERALALTPDLRAARLNLVFTVAALGQEEKHERLTEWLATDSQLGPAGLYVAGNSYLIAGDEKKADIFYRRLRDLPGWENKTEYYRSTFCFAHRRFEQALRFAREAAACNPKDTKIQYHLSLCYNALGDKDHALSTLNQMSAVPQVEWLDYYRFTLERDAGHHHEASQTLLRIPHEYFQDPEELEDALSFARRRQDLGLLRHLKRRK